MNRFYLFILNGISSGLSYLFQIVFARFGTLAVFGAFNSTATLSLFFNIGSIFLETTMTRWVSANGSHHDIDKHKRVSLLLKTAAVVLLIYAASSILIRLFLHIRDISTLLLLGFYIVEYVFISYLRGIVCGMKRFAALGISYVVENSLRILFLCFALQNITVSGTFLCYIGATAVAMAYMWFCVHRSKRGAKKETQPYEESHATWVLISIFALNLFTNADVLVAKAVFPADIVGIYTGASFTEKIVLTIISTICILLLPYMTSSGDRRSFSLLIYSFIGVFVGGMGFAALLFWKADWLLLMMFGEKFAPGFYYASLFSVLGALLGMLSVVSNYYIATVKRVGIVLFAATSAMYLLVLYLHHHSIEDMLFSMALSAAVFNIIHIGYILVDKSRNRVAV